MHDTQGPTPLEEPHPDRSVEVEQLREALASRTVTAQATGMFAARFRLHTDQAWALLCEASNMSNRKLIDIARVVVATHNSVPITDQADQQVAMALVRVLDLALDRTTTTTLDQAGGHPRTSSTSRWP